jgi:hypothetical protein
MIHTERRSPLLSNLIGINALQSQIRFQLLYTLPFLLFRTQMAISLRAIPGQNLVRQSAYLGLIASNA